MRLRQRLADELKQRLLAHLPEALETVWDQAQVLCVIEQLRFTPESGHKSDWQQTAEFSGTVRAEIHADGIDQLGVEPLIGNLLTDPPMLLPDDDTAEDALSEQARCVLTEWRDSVREMQVISALRLEVSGSLMRKATAPDAPELQFSQAPQTGLANQQNYQSVSEPGALLDG